MLWSPSHLGTTARLRASGPQQRRPTRRALLGVCAKHRRRESYFSPTPAPPGLRDTHRPLTMALPSLPQPLPLKAPQVRSTFSTIAPLSTRAHRPTSSLPETQAKSREAAPSTPTNSNLRCRPSSLLTILVLPLPYPCDLWTRPGTTRRLSPKQSCLRRFGRQRLESCLVSRLEVSHLAQLLANRRVLI